MQTSTNMWHKELPSFKRMGGNEQTLRPRPGNLVISQGCAWRGRQRSVQWLPPTPRLSALTLSPYHNLSSPIPSVSLRINSLTVPTHVDVAEQERGILPFSVLKNCSTQTWTRKVPFPTKCTECTVPSPTLEIRSVFTVHRPPNKERVNNSRTNPRSPAAHTIPLLSVLF